MSPSKAATKSPLPESDSTQLRITRCCAALDVDRRGVGGVGLRRAVVVREGVRRDARSGVEVLDHDVRGQRLGRHVRGADLEDAALLVRVVERVGRRRAVAGDDRPLAVRAEHAAHGDRRRCRPRAADHPLLAVRLRRASGSAPRRRARASPTARRRSRRAAARGRRRRRRRPVQRRGTPPEARRMLGIASERLCRNRSRPDGTCLPAAPPARRIPVRRSAR